MKNIFIVIFLFSLSSFSQVKDTLYFDKYWKKTDRKNHQFYRLLPLKTVGKLSLLIDYHKNGKMQMQGYIYSNNLETSVGDRYWYNQAGLDTLCSNYPGNKTNKSLKYYHHNGSLWKEITYKNGEKDGIIKVYDPKKRLRYSSVYEEGENKTIDYFSNNYFSNKTVEKARIYTLYWLNYPNKAFQTHYSEKRRILEKKVYSRNGELLNSYKKHDFLHNSLRNESFLNDRKESNFAYNYLKNGRDYKEKTENGFLVDSETVTYKSFQRKIINLKDVDYIDVSRGYDNFIKEKGDNLQCVASNLCYDEDIYEKVVRINLSETHNYNGEKSDLISVKKIKKQSVAKLLKTISEKQWESAVFKESNLGNPTDNKFVFKQFNQSFFVDFQLENENIISPHHYSTRFYTINVIVLNGNRPILAFSEAGDDFKYFIIPLNDGSFYIKYKEDMMLKNNSSLNKDITLAILESTYLSSRYRILRKRMGVYYIANEFNEVLIDESYDTIKKVGGLIIGKNNRNTDVYNLKLEKLPLKNIREAYYNTNIQVLSNNETFFINLLGDKIEKKQPETDFIITYDSCNLFIEDSIKEQPRIKVHYYEYEAYEMVYLTNLKNKQDISFLNQTKQDGSKGYSLGRAEMLLVKDNNKFGLYSYSKDIKSPKHSKETEAKELLPIEYDFIELREPLIILKKDNKFGIYKDKKGLIYKFLGEANENFMRYEKLDGEKGWIDANTLKEYKDE